jgi:hypothetical protein
MFRASTDGGVTFGDKVNLSNSTDADSIDAELSAVGENVVVVTWREWKNQTAIGAQGSTAMGTRLDSTASNSTTENEGD